LLRLAHLFDKRLSRAKTDNDFRKVFAGGFFGSEEMNFVESREPQSLNNWQAKFGKCSWLEL
jgi:hypothetical protein